jgi:hypothetical protein
MVTVERLTVERFVVVAPIPGRPLAFGGTVLETLSNGQVVESALTEIPVEQLAEWVESLNASAIADNLRLQKELAEKTKEWETLKTDKAELTTERDSALEKVATLEAELDTLKNPPNPDADWKSFRFGILADPAINRVATQNATAWPLMVLYLSQLDTMPSRGLDIAQLWNFLEANTAVDADEIARINAIAEKFGIPLRINEEGQFAV